MASTKFTISLSQTLLMRITLCPKDDKYLSFVSAFFLLSFPHFRVESTSMQIFFLGIKKSIIYGPIGFCASYFTFNLSRVSSIMISWGRSFFLNVTAMLLALLSRFTKSSLLRILMFSELASDWFRSLIPVSLAKLIKGVCDIPHILAILFIEYPRSQCHFKMTSSKVILKCFSIMDLDVILIGEMNIFKLQRGQG